MLSLEIASLYLLCVDNLYWTNIVLSFVTLRLLKSLLRTSSVGSKSKGGNL